MQPRPISDTDKVLLPRVTFLIVDSKFFLISSRYSITGMRSESSRDLTQVGTEGNTGTSPSDNVSHTDENKKFPELSGFF